MPLLVGRAAGPVRLAAVEPHLRRQPQRRHRALQRRLALHRRREADAGRLRDHAGQPARDCRRRRTSTCRAATSCWSRGCAPTTGCGRTSSAGLKMLFCAAAALRQQVADDLQAMAVDAQRPAHSARDRPGRDRELAVRAVRRRLRFQRRPHRRACARRRAEARARRAPVRGAPARAEHHARLLARRRADRCRVRRGRLLQAGRRARVRRSRRTRRRDSRSRDGCRKTSSCRPARGSGSDRCAQRLLAHFGDLLHDVVIAGHERDEVAALVFPALEACRALCGAGGRRRCRRRGVLERHARPRALPRSA